MEIINIIENNNTWDLVKTLNKMIREGWKPNGSIQVVVKPKELNSRGHDGSEMWYVQPMVKTID